jgi:hypothetical protein
MAHVTDSGGDTESRGDGIPPKGDPAQRASVRPVSLPASDVDGCLPGREAGR